MDEPRKNYWYIFLTLLFFSIVTIDLFGEYLGNQKVVFIAKPLISIILMIIYWTYSDQRNSLFIATLLFALISSVLFIVDDMTIILWGVAVFAIHRLLLIIFLIKILQARDYAPIIIASLPTLLIFFYLLSITTNISATIVVLFSINNFLISFFCGIVYSNYFYL